LSTNLNLTLEAGSVAATELSRLPYKQSRPHYSQLKLSFAKIVAG